MVSLYVSLDKINIPIDAKYHLELNKNELMSHGHGADIYKAHLLCNLSLFHAIKNMLNPKRDSCPIRDVIVKLSNKRKSHIDNEISCLLELAEEPHIIHIVNIDNKPICKKHRFICLELCKGGDLFEYVEKHYPLNEAGVVKIIKQLVRAVKECHRHNIIHCDIKLENIGLLKEGIDEIRLMDFGGSYRIAPAGTRAHVGAGTNVGYRLNQLGISLSKYYAPPETLDKNAYILEKDLFSIDLWELGITCYALIESSFPFSSSAGILYKKVKWTRADISDNIKKFVEGLLADNPADRVCDESILPEL